MKIERFDIFPKLREDYSRRSGRSGIITVLCVLLMSYLFVSQCTAFFLTPPKQRLRVDDSPFPTDEHSVLDVDRLPKMEIHFEILLPSLPCPFVNFGIIDGFKESHDNAFARVKLRRLDRQNRLIDTNWESKPYAVSCGSCYGASGGCCNSCKEVRRAFKARGRAPPPLSMIDQCRGSEIEYQMIKDEQCRVSGTVVAPPIASTLYIAPGDTYGARKRHVADYLAMNLTINDFNLSHSISSVFIGETDPGERAIGNDMVSQEEIGRLKAAYYIRTIREKTRGGELYRTTASKYVRYRQGRTEKFPGIFFLYDVSPVIVEYKRDVSVLHFLVNLMAILGGIYSVGTFLDHILNLSFASRIG
jgi:hypothetical protein